MQVVDSKAAPGFGDILGGQLKSALGMIAQLKLKQMAQRHQQGQIGDTLKILFPDADDKTIETLKQTPLPFLQQLLGGMRLQQYQEPGQPGQMSQSNQPSWQDLLSQPGASVNPMDNLSRSIMGFKPEQQEIPQQITEYVKPVTKIKGFYPTRVLKTNPPMTENQKRQLAYKEKALAFRRETARATKELTPTIVKHFLKKTGNDPKKAKELAELAGYKV